MPSDPSGPGVVSSGGANSGKFEKGTVVLLAVLAVYWLLLIYQLSAQWSIYEQYNYGWAVPFLCAFLIWKRVEESKKQKVESRNGEEGTRKQKAENRKQKTENGGQQTAEGRKRPFLLSTLYFLLSKTFLLSAFLVSILLLYAATRFVHEANPVWRLTSWLWALEVLGLTFLAVFWASRNLLNSSVESFRFSNLFFPLLCFACIFRAIKISFFFARACLSIFARFCYVSYCISDSVSYVRLAC